MSVNIILISGGETLEVASDGTKEGTVFKGNEAHIEHAIRVADRGQKVRLARVSDYTLVAAGYDSALALTAAMFAYHPAHTRIWRAPAEVTDFLAAEYAKDDHIASYKSGIK